MTLATLSFCIMVAAVKVARTEMGPFEVIVWRGGIAIPLALAFTWNSGFRMRRVDVFLARALFGFAAMGCFFTAAKGLPLADLSLITRIQPVLIALLAPLLLGAGERMGPTLWLALGVGLAGCAVLIGPQMSVGNRFGLWALAATAASALAHTAVRALGQTEAPRTVVFWFQVCIVPCALIAQMVLIGEWPRWPAPHLMTAVVITGVAATAGQLLMTKAYQQDRAPIVAAMSYSGPLWSVLLDLAVFGIVPGWSAAAGGALVIAAGSFCFASSARSPRERRSDARLAHRVSGGQMHGSLTA